MIRKVLGILLIACLACVGVQALPLTVLYTNDLHVRLDRFSALADAVATERDVGEPVLLFDAGDTWQDHRQGITNVWGSEQTIDWMNSVSYSAMAIGNHDTYWGPKRLSQLSSKVGFPILCANWVPVRGEFSERMASTILHVEDVDILVVGLITAEFLPTPAYPLLQYVDPVAALRAQLDLHEGDFDFAFVVAHVSINTARIISQQVPEIALFVTGHSHQRTPEPVQVGETIIVQSGAFGQTLGRLRVDADSVSGTLRVVSNDLIPIERTPVDVRAGVLKLFGVLSVIALATLVWLL